MATNTQTSQRPSLSAGAHGAILDVSEVQTVDLPEGGADVITMQAIDQNIYVTLEGSTPSPTLGFTLYAGLNPVAYPLASDTVIKILEATAGASFQYRFTKYN